MAATHSPPPCNHHRYTAGCRGCRRRAAAYWNRRTMAIAAGTWKPPVDLTTVLNHINQLRRTGMTMTTIAEQANIPPRTVHGLYRPGRRQVHGPTAAALLAVTGPNGPTTPSTRLTQAVGATRRIRALVAVGWTLTRQAELMGLHLRQVWDWSAGIRDYITVDNHQRVADLFNRLEFTPGPSRRARRMAAARGWPGPLAWDPDTIDQPDATPTGQQPPDNPDDSVDEVALAQAQVHRQAHHGRPGQTSKKPRRRATTLQPAEQAELYRRLAVEQGLSYGQIQNRLGLNRTQVDQLRRHHQQHHPQQTSGRQPAAS